MDLSGRGTYLINPSENRLSAPRIGRNPEHPLRVTVPPFKVFWVLERPYTSVGDAFWILVFLLVVTDPAWV